MQHETMWGRQEPVASYPYLGGDIATSVLVIGGGITGLAIARVLQERGHDVVVLELNRVGLGTTGFSTGHLDITIDTGMHEVVKGFGADAGKLAVDAARRALDRAEAWSMRHGIACDLVRVPGYLYADNASQIEKVRREAEAYVRAGAAIERTSSIPLSFSGDGGVRFERQIRFDPLDFTRGLARVFADAGGRVYEHTRVRRAHDRREGVTVETASANIEAEHLVIATHAPLFGLLSLQTRAHPFQSYVLALRVRDDVEDALYWDESEPYYYTRVLHSGDPRVLVIGGADHRTGDISDTESRFDQLHAYARDRYDVEAIVGRWSHEYFAPADDLPFVGKLPGKRHTYVATGFSGDGLAWGLVTAEVVADAIEGLDHALGRVIAPSRIKPVAAVTEMAAAGAEIVRHAVGDHLAFSEVDGLDEIPAGEGRLIRLGLRRLAVYRDDTGTLHAMSPVCRHAGCVVQWNNAARTWDCPCHGGRYDAHGKVIGAPPKQDLPREDLE